MKNILVSGGTGQLGQEITHLQQKYPQYQFDIMGRAQLDLESEASIKNVLTSKKYDYFINVGAYTAVDKAETDASTAYAINGMAMHHISNYIPEGCTLINVSTDYVYHIKSEEPLRESDTCNPQGVYARSKYQGEQFVRAAIPKSIILRTSWVYSTYGNNFVKTMLRLGPEKEKLSIVSDQVGTPTYARNIATTILSMIDTLDSQDVADRKYGTYNYTDGGSTNWADFARHIFEVSGITCRVDNTTTEAYGAAAPRPLWSVLSCEKIEVDYGIVGRSWKESLLECMEEIGG